MDDCGDPNDNSRKEVIVKLLEERFEETDEAYDAFRLFKLQHGNLYSQGAAKHLANGDMVHYFRYLIFKVVVRSVSLFCSCPKKGCKFSVALYLTKAPYYFWTPNAEHSHTDIVKVKQLSQWDTEVVKSQIRKGREEGKSDLDVVVDIRLASSNAEGMEELVNDKKIQNIKSALRKESLCNRAIKYDGVTFNLTDPDGNEVDMSDFEEAAKQVMKTLAHLQQTDKFAFVRVVEDDHKRIQYIFVCTKEMRVSGSLFGDLRVFDDKHGVSSSHYHLAACTVQTGMGIQPVALAFMASSNGTNWLRFINDCKLAFETTKGGPERDFKVSIADGDGQIDGAVGSVHPYVKRWSGYFHHVKNVNAKHSRANLGELHIKLRELLKETREKRAKVLMDEIDKLIAKINDGAAKEKEEEFYKEAKTRLLYLQEDFSNNWISQSAAESTNSALTKCSTGVTIPLGVAIDSVVKYSQKRANDLFPKCDKTHLKPLQYNLIAGIQKQVTKLCFELLKEQHDICTAMRLVTIAIDENHFKVMPFGWAQNTTGENEQVPRSVTCHGSWYSCSCNMTVWKGVTCRHIMAVVAHLKKFVEIQHIHSRWHVQQPVLKLKNASPFAGGQMEVVGMKTNEISEQMTFLLCLHRKYPVFAKDLRRTLFSWIWGSPKAKGNAGVKHAFDLSQEPPPLFVDNDNQSLLVDEEFENEDGFEDSMECFNIEGGIFPAPSLKPKEVKNEVYQAFYGIMNRIGLGPDSIDKFRSLEAMMEEWEQENNDRTDYTHQSQLYPTVVTVGKPPTKRITGLKPPNTKNRSNSARQKAPYKCKHCGQPKKGHTCRKKRIEIDTQGMILTTPHKIKSKHQQQRRRRQRQYFNVLIATKKNAPAKVDSPNTYKRYIQMNIINTKETKTSFTRLLQTLTLSITPM
jgi:hypothetical protein